MKIEDIIVKKRIRRDLGDLDGLMESIEKHGLLNPVVVSGSNVLLAGERRLESVKRLGWKTVPVRIVENTDRIEELEIEIDENLYRKPLSTDEAGDAFVLLDKLRNPGLFLRIWKAVCRFFRKIFGKKR